MSVRLPTAPMPVSALLAVALGVFLAAPSPILAQSPAALTKTQERLLDSLRRDVTDRLLASGKMSGVTIVGPMRLKAKSLGGIEVAIEFESVVADLTAQPAARGEVAARLVRAALDTVAQGERIAPPTREQFVADLRLIVRHNSHVRSPVPSGGPARAAPLWQPLAGDAAVVVVLARGEDLVTVRQGDGVAYGLDDAAVFDLARGQMQQLGAVVTREAYGPLRLYGAQTGSYSPSLLLLDRIVEELQRDLGPEFLVAIPDRTILLAASNQHAADLKVAVAKISQQRKIAPHIAHLIQRRGGGWVALAAR